MEQDRRVSLVDEFLRSLLDRWPESESTSAGAPRTLFVDIADLPQFSEEQLLRGFHLHYTRSTEHIPQEGFDLVFGNFPFGERSGKSDVPIFVSDTLTTLTHLSSDGLGIYLYGAGYASVFERTIYDELWPSKGSS
jgi:hypothetical protein